VAEGRPEMSRKNTREWQVGRFWRDKPVRERISAKHVLTAAGLDVRDIRSVPEIDQPPDCEAMIDGQWCGIEHTELVNEPTLKRSIRARRERQAGKNPEKPEAYFLWTQASLLAALQDIIDDKDQDAARMKGGPYTRYMLVIETEERYILVNGTEMFLNHNAVREFLTDACFRATRITDAFLSLSYEHDADGRGYYPVFPLRLVKR
jgi:hypothetical protein